MMGEFFRSFGPAALSVARSPSVVFNSTLDVDFQSVAAAAAAQQASSALPTGYEGSTMSITLTLCLLPTLPVSLEFQTCKLGIGPI